METLQRIGFTVIVLVVIFCSQISFADPALPTPVGRVVWVKGTIKAVMLNNEQRILQKMSVIYLHDTLITDAISQAQIVFTDESLMTFYPNTKFNIDQYVYKSSTRKRSATGKYVMNLIEGGFRTITGLIAKNNPNDYQVNTPVATIGVRGTDYATYIRNNQVYIGYYNGSPCIAAKNKVKNKVCLDAQTRYAFVPSADVIPVPLAEQPDVFKEKLQIIPITISPFGTQSQPQQKSGGPISSFCITQ